MWSEMCMALSCSKLANNYVPTSYRAGSWKWFRKTMEKSPKVEYLPLSSSIYHLETPPVRVRWNKRNRIESSLSELEEHHKWIVIIWSCGSSPLFPSNFGMFEGSLVGTGGQLGSWRMGSFINLDKYRNYSVSRNGNLGYIIYWWVASK
jgi:hypothetical protein